MRIISFSADGIQNAAGRGFYEWLNEQDAEFVCIQDLHCSEYDLQDNLYFPPEYNAYFFDDVNGKANGVGIYCKQLARKNEFYELLKNHLLKIRNKRREFIICGNWHIAHTAADVQDTERNSSRPGFLAEERQWMDELIEAGYVDAFREINSDRDEFSWWPEGDRNSNGWRTDFQIVSKGLKYNIDYGAIYKAREFSNHAPIIMDYDIEIA
jgi:exodeoxyribonuclease-3